MSEWLSSLSDLESMTAGTLYLVVFTIVFVESGLIVGFWLPGDTVLFTAGLLAADPDRGVSLPVLVTGVFVAAVAGDAVGYWTGRKFGRPWLLRKAGGRAVRHVERAEQFYERYGSLAVVVARFIPWVRTFTPIVAGIARMPYPRFLVANLAGAVCWGIGITSLGWFAYSDPNIRTVAYVIAGTAIVLSIVVPVVRAVRERRLSTARPAPEAASSAAAAGSPTDPDQPEPRDQDPPSRS